VEVRDRGALFLDVADDDGSEFRALAMPREDDGEGDPRNRRMEAAR